MNYNLNIPVLLANSRTKAKKRPEFNFCQGSRGAVAQSVKHPSKILGHGATLLVSSDMGSIPGAEG